MNETDVVESLQMMGVDASRGPVHTSPPAFLSSFAKTEWRSVLSDPVIRPLFDRSSNNTTKWELALRMIYGICREAKQDYIDPSRNAVSLASLRRAVASARSISRIVIDRSGILNEIDIVRRDGINYSASYDGLSLTLSSSCRVQLPFNSSYKELHRLMRQHGFIKTGMDYILPGMPNAGSITFSIKMPRIYLTHSVTVTTNFLPEEVVNVLLDTEAYLEYAVKEIWMPCVRKWPFHTVRRKNTLI